MSEAFEEWYKWETRDITKTTAMEDLLARAAYLAATERAARIAEKTGESYDVLKWPMDIVTEACGEIAQKIRKE